jgi:hypothetical protein
MCLALHLLVVFLLLLLPILFLFLVIIVIGALCYEMASLTAFEAKALSPCFILGGVLFASFERVLKRLMMRDISSSFSPVASTCATLLGSASLLLVALSATGCGS